MAQLRVARAIALVCVVGCGGGAVNGPLIPDTPILASRCRLGASQSSVLVTEWSAAEKANLEAMLGGGAVAVAFSGCELRLLPNCRLPGRYMWQRTTPSSDRIEIKSEAELFAKLPLGAVSLNAELKKSGQLTVQTTVAGQARLDGMQPSMMSMDPACAEATHLVGALSIGAFVLTAGGEASTAGGLEVASIGSGSGKMMQSASVVRSAGKAEACTAASENAPADCASPIQVFLAPIPGRAEPEGPPGTVRTDFVSSESSQRWDVYINDQATCTTPCSRWVDPSRPLSMRTREDMQKLQIDRLVTGVGPLQVIARPRNNGQFVTGLAFTTFGGMAFVTGVTLMGIGCTSANHSTMCHAGEISAAAGAVATAGALYFLLLPSFAKVHVRPLFGSDGMIVSVGPTGLFGSF